MSYKTEAFEAPRQTAVKHRERKAVIPSGKPGSLEVRSQVKNFTFGAEAVAQW